MNRKGNPSSYELILTKVKIFLFDAAMFIIFVRFLWRYMLQHLKQPCVDKALDSIGVAVIVMEFHNRNGEPAGVG